MPLEMHSRIWGVGVGALNNTHCRSVGESERRSSNAEISRDLSHQGMHGPWEVHRHYCDRSFVTFRSL